MTSFDIWLWLSLDNIRIVLGGTCLSIAIGCAWLGLGVILIEDTSLNATSSKKAFKWVSIISAPLLVFSLVGFALAPSTKDMAVIYFLPKIINNEQIQRVPEVAMKMLRDKLDELEGITKEVEG